MPIKKETVLETLANAREHIRSVMRQFIAGEISSADWQIALKEEIRDAHRAMFLIANNGKLDRSAIGRLGATIRGQNAYLQAFAAGVDNGDIPKDGKLVERAAMYLAAPWASYQAELRVNASGMQERRVLDVGAENCSDCIDAAAQGWVEIGTLPAIGESQCLVRCACHFEYQ